MKISLRSPEPITFARDDGSTLTVPPSTRGQIRRVIQCESDAAADPVLSMESRSRQVAILCEHGSCNAPAQGMQISGGLANLPPCLTATVTAWLDELSAVEESHILHALVAQFSGYDPALAVHVQQALEKKKP